MLERGHDIMLSSRLYAREIQILNTLFTSDRPMTVQDIIMENPGLSQSTVHTILRKLCKNGLVEVVEMVYSGNVLARAVKGTEKAKQEVLLYMVDEYQKISGILSIAEVVDAMLAAESDDQKRINLLQEPINIVSQTD